MPTLIKEAIANPNSTYVWFPVDERDTASYALGVAERELTVFKKKDQEVKKDVLATLEIYSASGTIEALRGGPTRDIFSMLETALHNLEVAMHYLI